MDNGKWPRNCKLSFYLTKNPNYVPIVGFRSFVIFCYQSDFYLARIFLSMKSVFCRRYSFLTYSYAIPGIGNARFHFAYTRVEGLIFCVYSKNEWPLEYPSSPISFGLNFQVIHILSFLWAHDAVHYCRSMFITADDTRWTLAFLCNNACGIGAAAPYNGRFGGRS